MSMMLLGAGRVGVSGWVGVLSRLPTMDDMPEAMINVEYVTTERQRLNHIHRCTDMINDLDELGNGMLYHGNLCIACHDQLTSVQSLFV
jgi:hypothetical protein